jgi:hypothetical protein
MTLFSFPWGTGIESANNTGKQLAAQGVLLAIVSLSVRMLAHGGSGPTLNRHA